MIWRRPLCPLRVRGQRKAQWKEPRLWVWLLSEAHHLIAVRFWGKPLAFSKSRFPHLNMGLIPPAYQGYYEVGMQHILKHLAQSLVDRSYLLSGGVLYDYFHYAAGILNKVKRHMLLLPWEYYPIPSDLFRNCICLIVKDPHL